MAQSITYTFLPLLSDSWVGLTGFTRAESSGAVLASGAGALAGGWSFCAHNTNTKKNNAKRTNRAVCNACLCPNFLFNAHLLFEQKDRTGKDTPPRGNVPRKGSGERIGSSAHGVIARQRQLTFDH